MKFFGKTTEPALVVGTIVALISLAGTLGFRLLSPDQAGLWILVVNGIAAAVMAWTTRPISPGVFTYLIGAIVALATAYGFSLTAEQVAGINGLVIPVLAVLTRGQVTPEATKVTNTTEAAGKTEVQTVPTGGSGG